MPRQAEHPNLVTLDDATARELMTERLAHLDATWNDRGVDFDARCLAAERAAAIDWGLDAERHHNPKHGPVLEAWFAELAQESIDALETDTAAAATAARRAAAVVWLQGRADG